MWSFSLFLKVFYCTLPTLLVMRWDDQMLTYWDEVWWTSQALWHSMKIILAWWYLEGSSALRGLGSSRHGRADGWRIVRGWWCWWLWLSGGIEEESERFPHATQNGFQFKTYEMFTFGIFHRMFSDHVCLW